jgi:para-aminobenzoate synthetase component I
LQIRYKGVYTITAPTVFYIKMLNWMNQFNIFCLLQTNDYKGEYNVIAGVNILYGISNLKGIEALDIIETKKDWFFGHLNYNLKNEIESLHSKHMDPIGFEPFDFFCPETIIIIQDTTVTIETIDPQPDSIFNAIEKFTPSETIKSSPVQIKARVNKDTYINTINQLKEHIQKGDCYEINFCQEFYAEQTTIDPVQIFQELNKISPNPFSAFYRQHNHYLVCASPERYLKKNGSTIISQPIKGTIKRDLQNPETDDYLKQVLQQSKKEQSENVMVVDLVRNDLSKICQPNTVKVEELYGVYSFPQVHHLVSTVTGQLLPKVTLSQIIKATFPMGSMTGAPKKRVLELIEQYEPTNRGIFSGSVGYITPRGNFDFNVVIRSIMYNAQTHYINYMVGSGITIYCDAEKEYEECLLKAKAMELVLR